MRANTLILFPIDAIVALIAMLLVFNASREAYKPNDDGASPMIPPPLDHSNSVYSPETVDEIIRELEWGQVVFNAPSKMQYEKLRRVELILSPSHTVEELQSRLLESSDAESADVQICNRMSANLSGHGFTVENIGESLKAVNSTEPTKWQWEVIPNHHGKRILTYELYAHIEVSNQDTPLVVKSSNHPVIIDITFGQRVSGFAQDNWRWLWAAVLVPIVGFLVKYFKSKRKKGRPAGFNPSG